MCRNNFGAWCYVSLEDCVFTQPTIAIKLSITYSIIKLKILSYYFVCLIFLLPLHINRARTQRKQKRYNSDFKQHNENTKEAKRLFIITKKHKITLITTQKTTTYE